MTSTLSTSTAAAVATRPMPTTSSGSTVVETVSIDYEDFNESFLTCGTCLCTYDSSSHAPKLLPCSHTICVDCLARIVATHARENQFRCPICRELVAVPQAGVQALPPSFLVNQLLDLMAKQRRDRVPKCATHQNQELLFCETCDSVFCSLCVKNGSHRASDENEDTASIKSISPTHSGNSANNGGNNNSDHTVIPFSIAIKRNNEILAYKANECRTKLEEAERILVNEMSMLDSNTDAALEGVDACFKLFFDLIENQRQATMNRVRAKRDEKKIAMQEQMAIINKERDKVEQDLRSVENSVDVGIITNKISELNNRLDSVCSLLEPKENAYILYKSQTENLNNNESSNNYNENLKRINDIVSQSGSIVTSTTLPSLCRLSLVDNAIAHVQTTATVSTFSSSGQLQFVGGDPLTVSILDDNGECIENKLIDNDDGTYDIKFTAHKEGTYCLKVLIFGRPIKDCPLFFDVTVHNSPLVSFGSRGSNEKSFAQPCNLVVNEKEGSLFVVDTGNARIKRMNLNLDFDTHIHNEELEGRSVTGLCLGRHGDTLVMINWRSRRVTEIAFDGHTLNSFTNDVLKEPTDIAMDGQGRLLVADNEAGQALLFDSVSSGKLVGRLGTKKKMKNISAVCVTPDGHYVLAGSSIQVYDTSLSLVQELCVSGGAKVTGHFGGVVCDDQGLIVASRMERGKACIQIFDLVSGKPFSIVDSHGAKLKRPTGLAIIKEERAVVVCDIASDCIRKYRYF